MSAEWDLMDPEFTVLVVCTGNVCRSPLAERLLQSGLDESAPGQFSISSAGTHGLSGCGAEPKIDELAALHGLSMSGFTARELTPGLINEAHLVLTLARNHRSHIVQLAPAALKRTFTLREFARILPQVPAEAAAAPAPRGQSVTARAQRHRRPPDDPRRGGGVDPYGLSDRVYEEMAAQLVPAVKALVHWERDHSAKAS